MATLKVTTTVYTCDKCGKNPDKLYSVEWQNGTAELCKACYDAVSEMLTPLTNFFASVKLTPKGSYPYIPPWQIPTGPCDPIYPEIWYKQNIM